ncbi:MAG: TonB-dependent receptor [Gammaproteobacteria bacterium]|nr:TonB-dependent receptor [Gammaproteobacteria bacterium]
MKDHKSGIIFWVLSLVFSTASFANDRLEHFLSLSFEELINLETTIATATKQKLSKVPAVVTVITQQDIKATGATNLADILEGVPGVQIRIDPFGNRPLIHFRGSKATQTLLMVNGTPIKDLMWVFGIFWKGLPVSIIDRIEIIRGPGSAIFGADAFAGVLNIITKTAGKIEDSEVAIRVGSFATKTGWIQHGTTINGFDIGFTAELHDTAGYEPFIVSDGQTKRDQTFNSTASLAPDTVNYGWHGEDIRFSLAKGNWRFQGDYTSHNDLQTGMTGASVFDPLTHASDSRYNIDLLYNNTSFHPDWMLNAKLGYQNLKYSSGPGFQEKPSGYTDNTGTYPDGILNQMRSAERRVAIETSGLFSGINKHAIVVGAGYSWEDLYYVEQWVNSGLGPDGVMLPAGGPLVDISDTAYAFAPEKTRKITHLFLEDIWSISDDWELTAGFRYDDYSDFGPTYNPRLALVWQSSQTLTTKLMVGQAFRAPSYQELFAETSRALPNDQLDAERSLTIDLSFSYTASRNLQLSLNLFNFEQSDIIQAIDIAGLSKKQFNNTGNHTIKGVELEARWQARNNLFFSGNYSIRDQQNDGFRNYQLSDQEAYIRADWGFLPKWNWNIQSNWLNERPRPETDSRPPLDDHFITDTTLRYTEQNWEFAASVRNLFDVDAREYSTGSIEEDLPLPERNFYIEMRYDF